MAVCVFGIEPIGFFVYLNKYTQVFDLACIFKSHYTCASGSVDGRLRTLG